MQALAAMLTAGLSETGWPKGASHGTDAMFELPEAAQRIVAECRIALSADRVAPPLLDAPIAYLPNGDDWADERRA